MRHPAGTLGGVPLSEGALTMRHVMRASRLAGPLIAAALLVAACGGGDGGGGETVTATDGRVTVEARDNRFDVGTIEAEPGALEITLVQRGSNRHTLVVEGVDDFKLEVMGSGESDTGTVDLDAGEYEFFCDVPGHRQQGMEGRIVVG
jgi:plastocyanin